MLETRDDHAPILAFLRSTALLEPPCGLAGCDSALRPFVGQKEAPIAPRLQAPPPDLRRRRLHVRSVLSPGYAVTHPAAERWRPRIPNTCDDTPARAERAAGARYGGPLSADPGTVVTLSAGGQTRSQPLTTRFRLLVLSPPAADAAALDKTNTTARQAAAAAVKMMGDAGISADRIEVFDGHEPECGQGRTTPLSPLALPAGPIRRSR